MAVPGTQSEPYEISTRFYQSLRTTALRLEANARKDDLFAASLDHPNHIQRQKRLVKAQRDRARHFWNFLTTTRIRNPEPAVSWLITGQPRGDETGDLGGRRSELSVGWI